MESMSQLDAHQKQDLPITTINSWLFHFIILMALVDAGYTIFVYIGANGSCADNRISEESGLPEAPKTQLTSLHRNLNPYITIQ